MWRALRLSKSNQNLKTCLRTAKNPDRSYSSGSTSGGKIVVSVLASVGVGFFGAVVYSKYDEKFKKLLKENVPYIENIYRLFPTDEQQSNATKASEPKSKDLTSPSLLKKKLEREKTSVKEVQKSSSNENTGKESDISEVKVKSETTEQKIELRKPEELDSASKERSIIDKTNKLKINAEEVKTAYESAIKAIQVHTKKLFEALDYSEGTGDADVVWKNVDTAYFDKVNALKIAERKANEAKAVIQDLKKDIKNVASKDSNLVKSTQESLLVVEELLKSVESKAVNVENEAKTAEEYQKLITTSREKFQKELKIVLPNYVYGNKDDKTVTESDLNLLIAHAHRKIEQLQKQLAKQQVSEKIKIDEAVRLQKLKDEMLTDSAIEAELRKKNVDLESAVEERVSRLKENFEIELRKQLHRQAAAHADHIQEVLQVQEQELEREFILEMEEKLLHQKGVFIAEVSGNMARLKGILAYLKTKSEFDKSAKKAQALWLACQSLNDKIKNNSGTPSPLGKDVAAVKIAADEESGSEFINTVLAGIPSEAINRGVLDNKDLQERFNDVKKACRRVALVDEENNSLYRFLLSYIQSFLVIDSASIPKAELDGKVAVDPSEWDTFDIVNRISFCLKNNDFEQALRYANQLKGFPRMVAKDWVVELKLHLETELAVKALLTHAAAIGVQAYH